jgi:hypothetical protein
MFPYLIDTCSTVGVIIICWYIMNVHTCTFLVSYIQINNKNNNNAVLFAISNCLPSIATACTHTEKQGQRNCRIHQGTSTGGDLHPATTGLYICSGPAWATACQVMYTASSRLTIQVSTSRVSGDTTATAVVHCRYCLCGSFSCECSWSA